jgi:hypothetical protein
LAPDEKGKIKSHSFIKNWVSDADLRKYEKQICTPSKTVDWDKEIKNTWEQYPVERIPLVLNGFIQKGVKLLINHIKLLSNNNEATYEYVIKWNACMFFNPERKNTSLLFQSDQGIGKGLYGLFTKNMMGSNLFLKSEDPKRDLFSNFNILQRNKLLIILEELDPADGKRYASKIKNIITESDSKITLKGVDSVECNDFSKIIMFTNHEFPMPVEKSDRRSMCIRIDSEPKDANYYEEGFQYANNPYVLKAVLEHLKTIDYTDYNFEKAEARLSQPFFKDLQEASVPEDRDFMNNLCLSNEIYEPISAEALYYKFKNRCALSKITLKMFTNHVSKFTNENMIMKVIGNANRFIFKNIKNGDKWDEMKEHRKQKK